MSHARRDGWISPLSPRQTRCAKQTCTIPCRQDAKKKWLGGEKSREPRAEKQKLIANGFSSKYLGHRMPDYPMLTGFTQC